MAKVSILGLADSRIIALAIARGFMLDGKTMFITDDTSYKRVFERDYDYDGEYYFGRIEDVDCLVIPELVEKASDNIENFVMSTTKGMGEQYKNIVLVSDEVVDKALGGIVIVRGTDESFEGARKRAVVKEAIAEKGEFEADKERRKRDQVGASPAIEIIVRLNESTGKKKKGTVAEEENEILLDGSHFEWLMHVEQTKKFEPLPDNNTLGKIAALTKEITGIDEERMCCLMTRDVVAE